MVTGALIGLNLSLILLLKLLPRTDSGDNFSKVEKKFKKDLDEIFNKKLNLEKKLSEHTKTSRDIKNKLVKFEEEKQQKKEISNQVNELEREIGRYEGMLSQTKEESPIDLGEVTSFVDFLDKKLESAFNDLGLDASGKLAVDIGSSTGGFTDFLLINGAEKVTAIDVGYGLLSWKLRKSDKVHIMERTNIRYLDTRRLPYISDLTVTDVSFISINISAFFLVS